MDTWRIMYGLWAGPYHIERNSIDAIYLVQNTLSAKHRRYDRTQALPKIYNFVFLAVAAQQPPTDQAPPTQVLLPWNESGEN